MRALILGDTGGIGGALSQNLKAHNVEVVGLSRAAGDFDLEVPETVGQVLNKLEGDFDLVFVTTGKLDGAGKPPEKALKSLSAAAMADQFLINAIGPAMVLKDIPRLLPRSRPSKVAVLTARVGSIGDNALGGWYSYRVAKAAANQVVHTAAIEISRQRKLSCVVALHPGTVATKFTADYAHDTVTPAKAARNILSVVKDLSPEHSGKFYDWKGDPVPW